MGWGSLQGTPWHDAMLCSAMQCSPAQSSVVPCSAMQRYVVPLLPQPQCHVGCGPLSPPCPFPCPTEEEPWGEWSPWGPCSASCGGGEQLRHRDCPPPGGCPGLALQSKTCNTHVCRGECCALLVAQVAWDGTGWCGALGVAWRGTEWHRLDGVTWMAQGPWGGTD